MKIAKITNINLYNRNLINKTNRTVQLLKEDKVAFCANLAPYNRVLELKTSAKSIKDEADEIMLESKKVEKTAYKLLNESKIAQKGAMQYLAFAKKLLDNGLTEYTFDDGTILNCSLNFESETLYLDVALTAPDETPIMDIEAVNFKPTNIQLYNDNEGVRIYDFIGDETVISTDVQFGEDEDVQSASNIYTFYCDKLLRLKNNVILNNDTHSYDRHFYFIDGALESYSEDVVEHEAQKLDKQQRRFTFEDNVFNGYFSSWQGEDEGLTEWDESYHYKNDEFIGYANSAKQKNILDKVFAKEVIYKNSDNKFILKQNGSFELDDFGEAVFKD